MQQLRHQAAASIQTSKPQLAPLARLSPFGGFESTIITTAIFSAVGAYGVAGSLIPALGGVGTVLLIVGLSLVIERLSRPLVLWGLGLHVYQSLLRIGGTHLADQIAHLYSSGSSISAEQFEHLINRSELRDDLPAEGHAQ